MSEQRLIDANRLKEDIKNGSDIRLSILKDQYPTIEARPVVRGAWILKNTPYSALDGYFDCWNYLCSNCVSIGKRESNFCSNCGADMREVTHDN